MSIRFTSSLSVTALTTLLLVGCGGPTTPAPAPSPDPFTLESMALPGEQPVLFELSEPIDAVKERFDREMDRPITPMEPPKIDVGPQPPRSPDGDTIVGKDLITGELFKVPARTEPLPPIPSPNLPPVNDAVTASSLLPNSLHALGGNLLTASNTSSDRSPVVLFEMIFPQNNKKSQCTGAMVDSQWMVTAAHCVYTHIDPERGIKFNEYANNIKVFGGYNGGESTMGFTYATQVLVTSRWRDQRNYNEDIAWVKLSRHMGALTKFYGYTAETCNFFKANTMQSHGYPAESPYDGKRVFGGSFKADACGGNGSNDIFVNTPAIGGQSGSAVRGTSQDPKYPGILMGVLSRSNEVDTTVITPLTAQMVLDLGNSIVTSTPKEVDLMAMSMRLAPPAVSVPSATSVQSQRIDAQNPLRLQPGTTLKYGFKLFNGSYQGFSGTVNYNVYLSSDPSITKGDKFLGAFTVNANIGPKSAVSVTTPSVPTPACAPFPDSQGYIGVVVTNFDFNGGNNDSSGEDALPVNTFPLPRC